MSLHLPPKKSRLYSDTFNVLFYTKQIPSPCARRYESIPFASLESAIEYARLCPEITAMSVPAFLLHDPAARADGKRSTFYFGKLYAFADIMKMPSPSLASIPAMTEQECAVEARGLNGELIRLSNTQSVISPSTGEFLFRFGEPVLG